MPWREQPADTRRKMNQETLGNLYHQMKEGGAHMIISGYGSNANQDQVDIAVILIDLSASERHIFDALDALNEYVLTARVSLEEFYTNADIDRSPDM